MDQALFLRTFGSERKDFLMSGTNITLQGNIKTNIECEFAVTNMIPAMDMYLGDANNPLQQNVSDDFYYLESAERTTPSTGLITQAYFYYFKNRFRTPRIYYHRKRFTCHTEIKSWRHYDVYVNILVKGKFLK